MFAKTLGVKHALNPYIGPALCVSSCYSHHEWYDSDDTSPLPFSPPSLPIRTGNHTWLPYHETKKGWQVIAGKTPKDPQYYFNSSTGESSFVKPRELMSDDELMEHDKYVNAKAAAERYVERIDALQQELEKLSYESDLKWAEEVELKQQLVDLKQQLDAFKKVNSNFWDAIGDRILPWRIYERKKQAAQAHLEYRKQLLKSKKDRARAGIALGIDNFVAGGKTANKTLKGKNAQSKASSRK